MPVHAHPALTLMPYNPCRLLLLFFLLFLLVLLLFLLLLLLSSSSTITLHWHPDTGGAGARSERGESPRQGRRARRGARRHMHIPCQKWHQPCQHHANPPPQASYTTNRYPSSEHRRHLLQSLSPLSPLLPPPSPLSLAPTRARARSLSHSRTHAHTYG